MDALGCYSRLCGFPSSVWSIWFYIFPGIQRARKGAVVRIVFMCFAYVQRSTLAYTRLALLVHVCMKTKHKTIQQTQRSTAQKYKEEAINIFIYIQHKVYI